MSEQVHPLDVVDDCHDSIRRKTTRNKLVLFWKLLPHAASPKTPAEILGHLQSSGSSLHVPAKAFVKAGCGLQPGRLFGGLARTRQSSRIQQNPAESSNSVRRDGSVFGVELGRLFCRRMHLVCFREMHQGAV